MTKADTTKTTKKKCCDKVRKVAITLGNKLTFQQLYDLANTEESTTAQMKAITQGNSEINSKETHSVRSGRTLCVVAREIRLDFQDHREPQNTQRRHRNPNNSKVKQNRHRENSVSNTVDVLDVEAITKGKHHAQVPTQHVDFAEKKDISSRYANQRQHSSLCEVIHEMFHILNCGFEIKSGLQRGLNP